MGDAVKSRVLSSHGLAHIKAELVKSKLENRRSRTSDGTPIAYSTIKDDTTLVPERTTGRRESRSYSDPDIPGSLVIFSEANGLFSNTNQVSSFKGKPAKINITSEEKQSGASKHNFKDLKSTFEQHSTVFERSHQQHMAEFSNPLHKGNQPRFRKGGGVVPLKPSIAAKPVVAPKPPKLSISTGIEQETNQTAIPKEDNVSNTPSKLQYNDDEHANVSHERPRIPSRPPPRKPSLQSKAPSTIYAQVDKSKKKSTLSNINQDDKLINRQNRSESDPSPSGVNVASGVKFEVLSQVLEAKQSSAENKSEAVISDEESDGWDPDEFDDDDDDSSEFELSSDNNSRSNSQGETETMVCYKI